MTIPLQVLIDAMATKPDGWYAQAIASGTVANGHLHVSRAAWLRVALTSKVPQLGDAFGVVAKPIAKALHLRPDCGRCDKRGVRWNRGGKLVA